MVIKKLHLGFSLIEAIVSLVILSGVLVASYAWIDNSLTALRITEENLDVNEVARNFLSEIDPSWFLRESEGEIDYGNYTVQWQASLLDKGSGVETNAVASRFYLALFEVTFEIYRENQLVEVLKTRKTAYRPITSNDLREN